jgi:RimJ/RimL family protein N-acetyltransferase
MPDDDGGLELAYWVRPEERGHGLAASAVRAATVWAHRSLAVARIWLEIEPGNEASLQVARRAGYHFEQRLAAHCRRWVSDDPERDVWHDCLIWVHTSDRDTAG